MRDKLKELINLIKQVKNTKYSESTSSRIKKFSKVFLLTSENFRESQTNLWTTTLSFYTIFSIVPILAIIFSIAKAMGFQDLIQREISEAFPLELESFDYIFTFVNKLLNNTKEGFLAVIAFLSLLWAIIKIFSLIEYSFNAIWKVENSRNIFRKATDYTAIVVLVPLAIIVSNIISAYINVRVASWSADSYTIGFFSKLMFFLLKYTALVTTCFLLSIIYAIIPNTKVKLSSAFISGISAGIGIRVLQFLFFKFQYFLLSYNAIYGSFSIIPIFLLLQRLFWNIILSGCHMSFIMQNFYRYDYSLSPLKLSNREQKNIALIIMYIIINNFHQKNKALSTSELAHKLQLSINLTQSILNKLLKLEFLNKIEDEDEEVKFQPAFDINLMTIKFIEDKLEYFGKNDVLDIKEDAELGKIYNKILEKINKNEDEILFKIEGE